MSRISRRHFFFGSLLAGVIPRVGFGSVPSLRALGYQSPNEKLNIAGIGAGGQALGDLRQHATENIVALADVDWARGAQGFQTFPKATKYKDFRQMLDKDGKSIDAVVIGTPDHTHATCRDRVHAAGQRRLRREAADPYALGSAAAGRRGEEIPGRDPDGQPGLLARSDARGRRDHLVGRDRRRHRSHAFRGPTSWPTGSAMPQIPAPTPAPDTLDWDLWLGPAATRPFTRGGDAYRESQNGFYLPFNWRGFHDFGTGLIGDWAIHIFGPANLALRLGSPTSVECVKQDGVSPFTFADRQHIRWEFPARGSMPPVTLHWYVNYPGTASSDVYTPPGMTAEERGRFPAPVQRSRARPDAAARDVRARAPPGCGSAAAGAAQPARGCRRPARRRPRRRADAAAERLPSSGYNQIFVGAKGYLGTSGRGEGVGLLPGSRWADYSLPGADADAIAWSSSRLVRAARAANPRARTSRSPDRYTEWIVLGAIATRVPGKLMWNAAKMEFTNNREANRFVRPVFRKGWEILS